MARRIAACRACCDIDPLLARVAGRYRPYMGHYYKFRRGDRVVIISGRYKRCEGVVDSAVFQRTVDYPDEYAPGYHVVLDSEEVVTVRSDRLDGTSNRISL